ncbi:glycosyltransferase family 4 protein [Achromobacter mucicolens]|uniref:glycosyltransferase family 4 protein n=1 Tax=Achromobacter mucicolens TaxID=1389922 RepID=UPI00244758D5|nr:glycosyltransferase family 4 protein [Achromobacter mucicolens]MDH0089875.1 glycosyltransferase family 4 protein [Achromobacter mucicolens]
MTRIAQLTTAHPRYDIRIYHKESRALARQGYDVHLIVADGNGPETRDLVHFHDIGTVTGRTRRMLLQPLRLLRVALGLQADIYHFHDPELLPVGLLLHWMGRTVVYDAHEDVPRQIMAKPWIPRPLRRLVSAAFEKFENFAARRVDAVICATPHITARFLDLNNSSFNVNNYPFRDELAPATAGAPPAAARPRNICYVGSITRTRGAVEMVAAMEFTDARLILAGIMADAQLETELKSMPGWAKVDYRGVVDRDGVRHILAQSQIGLVVLYPTPNHLASMPTKMFEYMSSGVPVLASNFPLWRAILDKARCGMCVGYDDPRKIATAINDMLSDTDGLAKMAANGRRAVMDHYNWEAEETSLITAYDHLASRVSKTS